MNHSVVTNIYILNIYDVAFVFFIKYFFYFPFFRSRSFCWMIDFDRNSTIFEFIIEVYLIFLSLRVLIYIFYYFVLSTNVSCSTFPISSSFLPYIYLILFQPISSLIRFITSNRTFYFDNISTRIGFSRRCNTCDWTALINMCGN